MQKGHRVQKSAQQNAQRGSRSINGATTRPTKATMKRRGQRSATVSTIQKRDKTILILQPNSNHTNHSLSTTTPSLLKPQINLSSSHLTETISTTHKNTTHGLGSTLYTTSSRSIHTKTDNQQLSSPSLSKNSHNRFQRANKFGLKKSSFSSHTTPFQHSTHSFSTGSIPNSNPDQPLPNTPSSPPPSQQQQHSPQTPPPTDDLAFSENGLSLARSRTNLVEVINGRSKRWLFDPKNKKKLHPQWMWHDDEETFDKMLAQGRGRFQSAYHDIINTARSFAYSVLLPAGYPDSVHGCYTPFSTWQFVETTFNQFIHVLCSQAMLSCVGLPTDTASAAGGAVAIRWIAKDGIAHFSKLFFTKRYAYQLDFRPKTWGMVSELLFICGSAFELSTAILAKYNSPEWFLPLAAFGASLQSVAHLAWEATHATFNKYLSLRNNLADVTAKADSQMVMSELLGMSLGLFYINSFNEPWHLWAAFLCALPLHLGSTFARLKAIKFGKLSSSRLLQHYNSYVQHRLGPTRLQPNVLPEDVLGATAEHIPPEIYKDKKKSIEYIKNRIEKSHLYNLELQSARDIAAQAAAVSAAAEASQAHSASILSPPPAVRPANATTTTTTPLPQNAARIAQAQAQLAGTSSPHTITQTLTSLNANNLTSTSQITPPATTSSIQAKKNSIDPLQELQAVQSIMSFATPHQFHYTDRRLGEWFDAKAWAEIYGYPEIKMCAPIDEAFETEDDLYGAVSLFRDRHYLVNYRPSTNKIYLTFEEECEHDDLLQSLLVASRLAYDIRKHGPPPALPSPSVLAPAPVGTAATATAAVGTIAALTPSSTADDPSTKWANYNIIRESLQWSLRYEDQITALLAEGDWDVDELTWPDTGARVYWEIKNADNSGQNNSASGTTNNDLGNKPPPINVSNIVGRD